MANETTTVDPLDLPDDELDSFDWDKYIAEREQVAQEADQEVVDESKEEIDETSEDDNETLTEEVEQEQDPEDDEDEEEDDIDEDLDDIEEPDDSGGFATELEEGSDIELEPEPSGDTEINYKEAYSQIFAPFRANGKTMQVDSVEDIRTLMSMGANYSKKMAGLKPNLAILKMLENHNLLDTDKLNYLIDLDKRDPEAIKKLVRDSQLDLEELDPDKEIKYQRKTYTVNDKEVELSETLDDIRDTDHYTTTLDIVSNKWDIASREYLGQNPNDIRAIHNHVESGIYAMIAGIMDKERMLGKFAGVPDVEVYKTIGDALHAAGKFDALLGKKAEVKAPVEVAKTVVKKTVDPKLKDKKRAAGSTKGSPGSTKPSGFNPLDLSDEEFAKLDAAGKFA